ncbi:MAG: hypothetical protein IPM79_26745 [Polyangiaceae bacterium]|jgi:hypothetical protein|nr:hypothetical protein [Polyangiaceae bacterium]MBK8941115.1 hypothetical protein [Polyangiaceae bacterium]
MSHITRLQGLKSITLALALGAFACGGAAQGMEALMVESEPPPEAVASDGATPAASTPAAEPAPPPAELAGPPPAAESPVKPFLGSYRYVGGVDEQRKLWGKIEGMANTFNFVAKGIVRDKLAAGNQIPKEIVISADADTLSILTAKTPNVAPMNGSSVKVRSITGEMMDMSYKVGSEIEQSFKGNAKGRVNRYEVQGDKLVLHVRVFAAQLPYELVYDLTYERVPPPAAPKE